MLILGAFSDPGALARVLLLQDYNTRVVVIGVTLLGVAAGLIGTFLLLRKRALLGDALSHATLPGIGAAFLLMAAAGGTGKWLPGLLAGAAISGVVGVLAILALVRLRRVREDAALGIVLSVFFGLGMAILGVIQNLRIGHAAGLESFIYGKTASMLLGDAILIAMTAAVVVLVCVLLFKEFSLLCFDPSAAAVQGWPVLLLDVLLMAVAVAVTVIGLQAVGLILVIALLVIPPAAARFWTHHLPSMLVVAALIGGASGYVGAALSALLPNLPAGAVIVLAGGVFFAVSLVFGRTGGLLVRLLSDRAIAVRMRRQHLLRALYELSERDSAVGRDVARPDVPIRLLAARRAWSPGELRAALRESEREGLTVYEPDAGLCRLTPAGAAAAWRVARNHRLWELFLIAHADIAPSHVDRDADQVEHVLDASMIAELERLLADQAPDLAVPRSPHPLGTAGGGAA